MSAPGVIDAAARLLHAIAPDGAITFQTFAEGDAKGVRDLTRIMHGTPEQHRQTLAQLNERGAGIFWMVNEGDGKGRAATNVQRIRALFVDLDGAPLEPVKASPLAPHAIVESSPGRWHAYWRVADCPPGQFAGLQKALAERFDADPVVCDLPRVMRLPDFMHCKGSPYRSRLVEVHPTLPPYTLAEFRAAFGIDEVAPVIPRQSQGETRAPTSVSGTAYGRAALQSACDAIASAPEGERNATLNREAFGIAQLVAGGELPDASAHTELERAGERAGLPVGEVAATLRSASKGLQHPRNAPAQKQAGRADASGLTIANDEADEDLPPLPAPKITDAMYYGLVGDVMRAASDGTEVNPAAAGIAFISFASAAMGRERFVRIGNDIHPPRIYSVHVGRSGVAGKGMALGLTRRIREAIEHDPSIIPGQGPACGNFHDGGLSSREGLAYLIRDPSPVPGHGGATDDLGVTDKRLFVVEEEFANLLEQTRRDGNTLSPALRTAWDGHDLAPATKTNRTRATAPHIAMHACITPSELSKAMDKASLTNGFANRILFVWGERLGEAAFPPPTPDALVQDLARRTLAAIGHSSAGGAVPTSQEARDAFVVYYRQYRRGAGVSAKVRGLLDRYPPYAWRLALLFALLDCADSVERKHMTAALAWLDYCQKSTMLIFSSAKAEDEAGEAADLSERIACALRDAGGELTREALHAAVGKPGRGLLNAALDLLETAGRIAQVVTQRPGGGRPLRSYRLIT